MPAPLVPRVVCGPHPPPRLTGATVRRLQHLRSEVGARARDDWNRVVTARDPVTTLKRRHRSVNRATFKMHEIAGRLEPGTPPPRTVVLLAEAPGGFLQAVRKRWPGCRCVASSYSGTGAIPFAEPDDAALVSLPRAGDLRLAEVEDALAAAVAERLGASRADRADLVTADGGEDHTAHLDDTEQHSTVLVLAQLATALRVQAQGGTLVLKVFEGSTTVTRQIFQLLRGLYRTSKVAKPLCSKAGNSERYFVAEGLHDVEHALAVGRSLREGVERCMRERLFPTALEGVTPDATVHVAFDTMSRAQAGQLEVLLETTGDAVHALRRVASREARTLERTVLA